MKAFILALALLFTSATLAEDNPSLNMDSAEFTDFAALHIELGQSLAETPIYSDWLNYNYFVGSPNQRMTVAMRLAVCSIMWREVADRMQENDVFTREQVLVTLWRALEAAKIYVHAANRDPDQTETVLIPMLIHSAKEQNEPTFVSDSSIYTCVAIDTSLFYGRHSSGLPTEPPEDWKLEPIPEFEPKTPETEEKGKIAS